MDFDYYSDMSDVPSLLELFDNMEKDAFVETTLHLSLSNDSVPLHEITEILDETIDLELVSAIVEMLIYRFDDVVDDIILDSLT